MRQLDLALGPGRLRRRGRRPRSSAPTPTPTTTGSPRRSPSGPAASSGCTRPGSTCGRSSTTPQAALEQRIEVARQSGVPAAVAGALPAQPRRKRRNRDRRDQGPRPRARARGRGRDRPRRLAGLRDPRPRALARRPAPARAPADALRRPPARPHRPLLRPRPHARPGRRVPLQPRPRSSRSTSSSACPATAAPSATPRRRSPRRAARSTEMHGKVRDSLAQGERDRLRDRRRHPRRRRTSTDPASAWVLQIVLSFLDHMALAGEAVEIEGGDPHRWSLT